MHRRLIVAAPVFAGLVLGLVFGGTFAGTGPVSLLGDTASHDDPVVSSSDDDRTPPVMLAMRRSTDRHAAQDGIDDGLETQRVVNGRKVAPR